AATSSASLMPSCRARSHSRTLGLSERARRISSGDRCTRASMCLYLFVENELALAGDLQPVVRSRMLDADLARTLEQRMAGDSAKRAGTDPLLLPDALFGDAQPLGEAFRIVRVHGDPSLLSDG